MENKKIKESGHLFDNKKFVLLFSVVAAVVFWVIITVTESPASENTIAGLSISVPTENSVASDLGLDVIDDVSELKASVTVTGPAYVVSSLGQEDLAVTASVSKVTSPGNYELDLKAVKQSGSGKGEFEIVSVSPSSINVTFDYIDTQQFTVTAQAVGASAIDGLIAENPVVSDSNNATLTFKGSRTNIKKISKVVAVAEVNSVLSKTQSFASVIEIYDSKGNKLSESDYTITTADGLSAPDVQVTVPISKIKTVSLKAQFVNIPKIFAETGVSHKLSYNSIDIIGPPETIDDISSLLLSEIDFDNISENEQTFRTSILLSDGVKSVDNIEEVGVTVTGLENYTLKTYTVSKISIVSNNTSYSATLSRNIKNVKICGPKNVLKNISIDDLYAEADISGKQQGEHTVPVRIKCKSSGEVWQVGSYTAAVEIK